MRTTIEIDDQLIRAAMRASGAKTKRETVEFALRTLVRLGRQVKIRRLKGQAPWYGDLARMRGNSSAQTALKAASRHAKRP